MSREPSAVKIFMQKVLGDGYFTAIMTMFTIYALFGDDLKLLSSPHNPDVDAIFMVLSSIAFFSLSS